MPKPFHVFATRNPIEQEGTYHLPEAALDRFMLSIHVDYPETQDEVAVVRETTGNAIPEIELVISGEEVQSIQHLVRNVPVAEEVMEYAVRLAAGSRPNSEHAIEATKDFVRWGAGLAVPGARSKSPGRDRRGRRVPTSPASGPSHDRCSSIVCSRTSRRVRIL